MPPVHPLGCQSDSRGLERAPTCSGEPSISAPREGSTPLPARQCLQRGTCPYAWCSLLPSPRGRTVYHPSPRGAGAKCSWFPDSWAECPYCISALVVFPWEGGHKGRGRGQQGHEMPTQSQNPSRTGAQSQASGMLPVPWDRQSLG